MMRSMFSGVSGLRVHQTKMDVIANNISNVNTVGYKSNRVTFMDVFNQTVQGATRANPDVGRGGTNPMQIGLGANIASIDTVMTTGAAQRTDNPYDVMIQGDGFFVVKDGSGTYFTRAGAFRVDEQGYVTMPNGMLVCGWDAVLDTDITSPTYGQNIIQKGPADGIHITGEDLNVSPKTTTSVNFEGNFNPYTDKEHYTTMGVFDSLGNRYVVDVKFTYNTGTDDWSVAFGKYAYPNGDQTKPYEMSYTQSGNNMTFDFVQQLNTTQVQDFTTGSLATNLKFTNLGKVDTSVLPGFQITFGGLTNLTPLAQFSVVDVDFTDLTEYNATADATAMTVDGNESGQLAGIGIGSDGIITGRYTNGKTKILAQIVLAKFKNPAGLEKAGTNLFRSTRNSGDFDGIGVEATSGGSSLLGGVLEMSNVDLSNEFTEMITTQRGFQANSRIITTSDEMLQELVNLKR